VLDQAKNEPVLKPHVLQDALSDVAKEKDIPQLLDSPIAQHFSYCQEVYSVTIVISVWEHVHIHSLVMSQGL